jgi:pimeloyl-ACP methyl ester carboxylesterase
MTYSKVDWVRILLGIVLATPVCTSGARAIDLPAPGEEGGTLALHCVEPSKQSADAVLFIHGASFPTMLAAGFEFSPKDSWMRFMANKGFLACGLDFLGFGESSRPPAMQLNPTGASPIDTAASAAAQISLAVDYLVRKRGIRNVHFVAHSWGTIPAALYVSTHPSTTSSLTLFGPVVPKLGSEPETTKVSWWAISAQERYAQLKFVNVLPPEVHLLEARVDQRWATEFALSASSNKSRDVNQLLRIPAGPTSDLDAAQADRYPYRPQAITAPVFVVYGSYDTVVSDTEAAAFLERFTGSPLKWRLRIDDGTHVMHLEKNRKSLYQSVLAFITAVAA